MLDTPRPDSEDRTSPPPTRKDRTVPVRSSALEDRRSPEIFEPHHDFPALMVGARRKAAPLLGAPGINRHLGIWVPDDLMLKRADWISNIEKFFVDLYRELYRSGCHPDTPHARIENGDGVPHLHLIHRIYSIRDGGAGEPIASAFEQTTRHQRLLVSFTYSAMPVDLAIELFDEYFTLSTSIDLSRCTVEQASGPAKGTLLEAVKKFYDTACARYDEIKRTGAAAPNPQHLQQFKAAFDFIYYRVWEDLYKDIFPTHDDGDRADRAKTLGRVFADLRSFVACRERPDFTATRQRRERPLDKAIGVGRFDGIDAIRCVDAIRPFMEADALLYCDEIDNPAAECLEPREFTFTPIVDKRFIYGSALGAPPSHLQDRSMPVAYILLAANNCPSENGLLVDGVNTLGTTRLAALYDFPHLMNAALELRALEGHINDVRREIDVAKTDAPTGRRLPNFSQRLAEIEQGIKEDSTDKHPQIVGGLSFRVERSRYYQRQFRGLVKGLRIGRIQGFLTYDEAVARRLGGIYHLIDTVGLRHERLRETLAGLSRRTQARQQLALTKAIDDETGIIQNLQKKAEIGFFLVLFPYYTSHVFIDVANRFSPEKQILGINLEKWILCCSILTGVAFWFHSMLVEKRKIRSRKLSTSILLLLILSVGVITSVVSYMTPEPQRTEEKTIQEQHVSPPPGV